MICDEWLHDFQAFYDWAMSNGYADDLTIDRTDNDGNYEPGNCRWATQIEQQHNKSTNILITYDGKTQDIKQWSEELGICYNTLFFRITNGWPVEKAFTEPVDTSTRNRYPELITKPGENRDLMVKEHHRRESGTPSLDQRLADRKKELQDKAAVIHKVINENPGISVRKISEMTGIPKSTVQRLKALY